MLFLQCGECGFKTVPGTLEFGAPCPRCVSRGDRGQLTAAWLQASGVAVRRRPSFLGGRRRHGACPIPRDASMRGGPHGGVGPPPLLRGARVGGTVASAIGEGDIFELNVVGTIVGVVAQSS